MTSPTRTAFAVMRKMDDRARAIFTTSADAAAYARQMNEAHEGPTFSSGAHLWTVYPWTVPGDTFDCEETQ